jgi:hypothetical protein
MDITSISLHRINLGIYIIIYTQARPLHPDRPKEDETKAEGLGLVPQAPLRQWNKRGIALT